MRGRMVSETQPPSWVRLEADERILFSAQTDKRTQDPTSTRESVPETVLVTTRRFICLSRLPARGGAEPALTTLPLRAVQAIQTTRVKWNTQRVLLCILAFVLYIVPGVIFLIWMHRNAGPRVNIVSGNLRTEVRFFPSETTLLTKFLGALDAEACRVAI